MSVIEAAIGAGTGIAGAVSQAVQNKKMRDFEAEQSQLQREWNEKMYNQQNAWNYEMWQKQNEYNTPAEQKQRLLDAGLNPLFYGLDGTGNAGALESAQPLGYDRASVGNQLNPVGAGINASMQAAMAMAQIENLRANTAKQNNENITETTRREKMLADIDVAKQQLLNMQSQKDLTDAQRAQIEKALEWADRLNAAILHEKEASAALSEAQKHRIIELLEGEKLIQSKTIVDFDKKWKKIEAEISRMAAETGLLKMDIANYALNHASNGFMGSGLSFQNFIRFIFEQKGKSSKSQPYSSDNYQDVYYPSQGVK